MTQPVQNQGPFSFVGIFPITAPDIAVSTSADNPSAGGVVDSDALMTETTSELQNLQQDLLNRLTELPGTNLDFGSPNSRGVGIMTYLNAPTTKIAGLPARIDAEFVQDPRVRNSFTSPVTQQEDGSYLVYTEIEAFGSVFGLGWQWSQAGVYPIEA